MDVAPIRPILLPAIPASHLVDNLPGKRRRRKPRPRHRPLPVPVHKPRHRRPCVRPRTTAPTSLRLTAVRSQFHPSNLADTPVHRRPDRYHFSSYEPRRRHESHSPTPTPEPHAKPLAVREGPYFARHTAGTEVCSNSWPSSSSTISTKSSDGFRLIVSRIRT